jgi:hypothetical protein
MSVNQHRPHESPLTQNQKNQMSEDDLQDGSRRSAVLGRDGPPTAAEKKPEQDEQDQSTIEAFGEEGAGVAAKE